MLFRDVAIVIDEEFYFAALAVFERREAPERPFSFTEALREYLDHEYLAAHWDAELRQLGVGSFDGSCKEIAFNLVMAVFYASDHEQHRSAYIEGIEESHPKTQSFVRSAGWSFLRAWCDRYGGLRREWVNSDGYVRPWVDSAMVDAARPHE